MASRNNRPRSSNYKTRQHFNDNRSTCLKNCSACKAHIPRCANKKRYGGYMKIYAILTVLFLALFTANAQTTQYTYQGRLNDGSLGANGSYDFQFELYDAA